MLTIRNYVRPQSLKETYELNQKKTSCIMGGMMWLRMGNRTIQTMIDLSDLKLDFIEETEEQISIGAMATLRQIEKHEGLQKYTMGAVEKAVKHIVGVQFRNTATVGGSIFGRYGFSDVMTVFLMMDTYVELYPHTGRTHQLRVHCAYKDGLGIPIVGDDLYGTHADRLLLHAETLDFVHPVTKNPMHIECKHTF